MFCMSSKELPSNTEGFANKRVKKSSHWWFGPLGKLKAKLWRGRMRLAGEDCQEKTGRRRLAGKDWQEKTGRKRLAGEDYQETSRRWLAGEDCGEKTGMMRLAGEDWQKESGRRKLSEGDWQEKIGRRLDWLKKSGSCIYFWFLLLIDNSCFPLRDFFWECIVAIDVVSLWARESNLDFSYWWKCCIKSGRVATQPSELFFNILELHFINQ
jgi:hypothetical protein